jgi:hypothetical protein
MLIYNQRNFDLHLTQLNCAIANWATIIHILSPNTNVTRICDWATANLNP